MRRKRKMIIIFILVLAVCGLSVGLATFSNVLTISSSARVKPTDGEYKVTIYGFSVDPSTITNVQSREELFSNYTSTTYSIPEFGSNELVVIASPATIDNNTFEIKNISVTLSPTADSLSIGGASYYFTLVNEGAYDIYGSAAKIKELISGELKKICTATEQSKQTLVDEHCDGIIGQVEFGVMDFSSGFNFSALDSDNIVPEQPLLLKPGEYIVVRIAIGSFLQANLVNETGEFFVLFEDILLPFGSTAISSE